MVEGLARLVPREAGYRHGEGNSDAHIKASLMGSHVLVPVENGRLRLGTWQSIYLAEFDGPRTRRVWVVPCMAAPATAPVPMSAPGRRDVSAPDAGARGDADLRAFVERSIADFLAVPENNTLGPGTTGRAWDGFLVGYSSGADDLYAGLKEHIGPFHWTPAEAFALGLGATVHGAPDGPRRTHR